MPEPPSLFVEQPPDERGETMRYPTLMTTDPRKSWTSAFHKDDVNQPCKGFVAKVELVPKYKFGVEVTKNNTREALELDRINGNNLLHETIQREMSQLSDYKTFRLSHPGESLDANRQFPYHKILYVKSDGRGRAFLFTQCNPAIVPVEKVYAGAHHGITGPPLLSDNDFPHTFTVAHEDIYKKKCKTVCALILHQWSLSDSAIAELDLMHSNTRLVYSLMGL
jgi:hypothetical protein